MTNAYDPNYEDDTNDSDLMPYDDAFDDEDLVAELLAEGYSEEEARRMVGDYNADEFYGFEDDSDGDFE
ncbi:MAG: hypothetical protein EBR82_61680 [Caulobacteraceae bacterium]|nr:hypothetical protein [Caulobacteraceae bacterium]